MYTILRSKFGTTICLILLFTIATGAIFVAPLMIGSGEDLIMQYGMMDHWQYYVPAAYFLDHSISTGSFPLWNPLTFCGTPFAANPQSLVFYPPNLIRSLLTPNPTPLKTHIGLVLMVLLHLLMAAVGTYKLARSYSLSKSGSVASTAVFIFSGALVHRTYAGHFILTLTWLPIVLLLTQKALTSFNPRRAYLFALAAGLVFGLSILAGSPHMTYLLAFTTACYIVLFFLTTKDFCRQSFHQILSSIRRHVAVGLTIAIIGGLTACIMLLPTFEFADYSIRGQQPNLQQNRQHTQKSLLTMASVYGGVRYMNKNYRLAGLGALLLALAALAHHQRRKVLLFLFLFVLLLNCALGPPLPFARLYLILAPFKLSDPTRALLVGCLPFGILAGFGVDAIVSTKRRPLSTFFHLTFISAAGLSLLIFLISTIDSKLFVSIPKFVTIPPAILFVLLVGTLIHRLANAANFQDRHMSTLNKRIGQKRLPLGPIFAALVFLEIAVWNLQYVPFLAEKGRQWRPRQNSLESSKELWQDNTRNAKEKPNTNLLHLQPAINGYDPLFIADVHELLVGQRQYIPTLMPSYLLSRNVFAHLFLKRQFWLARQYALSPLPKKQILFPATTTVFLSQPPKDMPLPSVTLSALPHSAVSDKATAHRLATAKKLRQIIKQNKDGKGTMYYSLKLLNINHPQVHSSIVLTYRSSGPALIKPSYYEPSSNSKILGHTVRVPISKDRDNTVEIPLPDLNLFNLNLDIFPVTSPKEFRTVNLSLLADTSDENHLIKIHHRQANRVLVEVGPLANSRILTFLDADYPGWKALLNGKEVPILRANDAFKAIALPPGHHQVEFVFKPTIVYIGAAVSLTTVVLTLIGLACLKKTSIKT